jgi:hypothetical protein
MRLRSSQLDPAALPKLQELWNAQLAPHTCRTLAHEMQDLARGYGRNTVLAWRGEEPTGCAGWVTLGIAQDGCAYGAPVVAADVETASTLIGIVCREVRAAAADRLRISTRVGEDPKLDALRQAGFKPMFEFVHFSRSLPFTEAPPALPYGLRLVHMSEIDWNRLRRCYAESFAGVPNAPIPDEDTLQAEWSLADNKASLILADEAGEYQAFMLVNDAKVDSMAVCNGWRGKDVPAKLYHLASIELLAQGKTEMQVTKVASINAASMRTHQKLGFTECAPRWTVHELAL